MSWATVAPFLVTATILEITPGPNMGLLALISVRWGRAAGLSLIAGITLGLAAYLSASAVGLVEVARTWPWVLQILRWSGVAYLLWLAWDTWRPASQGVLSAPLEPSHWRLARQGMVTNLLNPKVALFYLVLLPGFIDPKSSFGLQIAVLGGLHLLIAASVHTVIVLAAARVGARYGGGLSHSPALRLGLALGLVAIAAWLAFETRGMA